MPETNPKVDIVASNYAQSDCLDLLTMTDVAIRKAYLRGFHRGVKKATNSIKPANKADLVRSLSDEEFAEFLAYRLHDIAKQINPDHLKPTAAEWLSWLKEAVKYE